MIPEYQFYHGALLHEIVITAKCEVHITLQNSQGRPDAYVIDGRVGLLIKHSSARITPWSFTFTKEQIAELHKLRAATRICFVCFVCGEDGFVCVRDSEFVEILTPTESDMASIRVDRRPRKMYGVSSSGKSLDGKLANGVQEIIAEIIQSRADSAVA
jgi:hypothetical protein